MRLTFLPGVIYRTFQGELKFDLQQVIAKPDWEGNERTQFNIAQGKHPFEPCKLKSTD